jgi:hypothetical protein
VRGPNRAARNASAKVTRLGCTERRCDRAVLASTRHDGAVRALFLFLLLLLVIGGGMRLAGLQLPILDYPIGGPMAQPRIVIQQPNLNVP